MLWLAGKAARSLWLVSTPLIALAVAALFLAASGELHGLEAAYPRLLAVLIALLAVVSVWRDAVDARRTPADPSGAEVGPVDPDAEEVAPEGGRGVGMAAGRTVAFVAVLVLTSWLMGMIGFFPAATLLVLGGLVILGVRAPRTVLAYTVAVVGVAYLLFVEALGVPFPAPWS
jgi:putative tricarboxylic transport membrane protein